MTNICGKCGDYVSQHKCGKSKEDTRKVIDRNHLRLLRRAGMSLRQIASVTGISAATVMRHIANQTPVKRKIAYKSFGHLKGRERQHDYESIYRLKDKGYGNSQIAKELDYGISVVEYALKKRKLACE